MMGRTVISNQSGAINRKYNMKFQQAYILHNLVICALQKSGIQGNHRNHSLLGKTTCHRNSMLFCNTHIKKPLRVPLHQIQQTGTSGHGRCNRTYLRIGLCKFYHGFAEGIGESLYLGSQLFTGIGIEFSNAMKLCRILFRKRISAALFGNNMNNNRLMHLLSRFQKSN